MDLKQRLGEDLKTGLRSGDKLKVSVIRLLTALIKNREVEKRGPLTEAEVIQAISSSCKQRQEAIEQFRQGGRQDLVDKESAELGILQAYLPSPLTPEELQTLVREAIREVQAASPKEMGKVMAVLMPKVTGRADGKLVSTLVREALVKSG
ncbi:MAG TPA: GatB/YqeY domain-containing protein [Candidatus Methylomirabilis sp.]|nr:GatB/YqeY domain-containing protein [Candidatus Methylomirabilis sp.]